VQEVVGLGVVGTDVVGDVVGRVGAVVTAAIGEAVGLAVPWSTKCVNVWMAFIVAPRTGLGALQTEGSAPSVVTKTVLPSTPPNATLVLPTRAYEAISFDSSLGEKMRNLSLPVT